MSLASERVVIQSPLSFTGSAKRIWKLTRIGSGTPAGPFLKWLLLIWMALLLIACAWIVIACWYALFGLLVVPWRLLRRGQRKEKRDRLRHREALDAINRR